MSRQAGFPTWEMHSPCPSNPTNGMLAYRRSGSGPRQKIHLSEPHQKKFTRVSSPIVAFNVFAPVLPGHLSIGTTSPRLKLRKPRIVSTSPKIRPTRCLSDEHQPHAGRHQSETKRIIVLSHVRTQRERRSMLRCAHQTGAHQPDRISVWKG